METNNHKEYYDYGNFLFHYIISIHNWVSGHKGTNNSIYTSNKLTETWSYKGSKITDGKNNTQTEELLRQVLGYSYNLFPILHKHYSTKTKGRL